MIIITFLYPILLLFFLFYSTNYILPYSPTYPNFPYISLAITPHPTLFLVFLSMSFHHHAFHLPVLLLLSLPFITHAQAASIYSPSSYPLWKLLHINIYILTQKSILSSHSTYLCSYSHICFTHYLFFFITSSYLLPKIKFYTSLQASTLSCEIYLLT